MDNQKEIYQYEIKLFKKHNMTEDRVAISGGKLPRSGTIGVRCLNTENVFYMGYYCKWNEIEGRYEKAEYEYKYCPLCGKKLERNA